MAADSEHMNMLLQKIAKDTFKFGLVYSLPVAFKSYTTKQQILDKDLIMHVFYIFIAVALYHLIEDLCKCQLD